MTRTTVATLALAALLGFGLLALLLMLTTGDPLTVPFEVP